MTVTLTRVTISGADDRTPIREMRAIAEEFPFVEWGILLSASRMGRDTRYPSRSWIDRLAAESHAMEKPMQLSAHLCGSRARSLMDGDISPLSGLADHFRRVQINGFDAAVAHGFMEATRDPLPDFEFILQAQSERALHACTWVASMVTRNTCSVLFDPSGGRNIDLLGAGLPRRAEAWLPLGFAGGISPENVVSVVSRLEGHGFLTGNRAPTWIDMESGVRSGDDALDLGKVVDVLTRMKSRVRAWE